MRLGSPHHGELHGRLNVFWVLIILGGAILGARIIDMQLLEGAKYARAAELNSTQIIYQVAPRGRFYDRNGVIIASNRPTFSLIYFPERTAQKTPLEPLAKVLAREIKQDPEDVLETLQQAVREGTAVRLAENLPAKTMFRLSELKTLYRGVDLIIEAQRHYPNGNFASHLLGYMGKMDPRSWRELKSKGYRIYSRIGKTGLERIFESVLKGRDGGIRMEVDAQGRLKRILEKIPWREGRNVQLTLDAAIQKAAEEGLRNSPSKRGAVVVLDPRDGSILALASAPDYDPNALITGGISEIPEFNKAISGTYPPGSIFKIVVGAAGLNEGKFDEKTSTFCPGYFAAGRRVFLCWKKKGHRRVSWYPGMINSCDVYFYTMGLRTTGALIERYSKMFGLGAKTNIALRGEKRGNLFGPEKKSHRKWYDGDTLNLAIGQGELLVTPIQMAVLISAVANRGILWRPHFTERIMYGDGRPDYVQKAERLGQVDLSEKTWDHLQEALRLVVSSGTGRSVRIPGLDIAGKTGTAQNPGKDHAWFISYAARPGEPPSVAAAVLVENGGHGSTAAAPIAKQIYLAAFNIKPPEHRRRSVKKPPAHDPSAAGSDL